MEKIEAPARIAAAVIAIAAWVGLGAQLSATSGLTGSVPAALWGNLRFFTIVANLAAAGLFTAIALGSRRAATSFPLGGAALALLLVGIVHFLLLRDLPGRGDHSPLAEFLLHTVTPVLAPLYWIVFAAKGRLGRRDPWLWAMLPLGYFAYALVRGAIDGKYPYPFMNVAKLGWAMTAVNALIIAAGFMLAGYGLVWLDGRLSRSARPAD